MAPGRCVISVIINLICVFILQSNEHIEKLAHESDALSADEARFCWPTKRRAPLSRLAVCFSSPALIAALLAIHHSSGFGRRSV